MTVTLNKKESNKFLKKMLETEKKPISKIFKKLAKDVKKNSKHFNKIRRKVVCVFGKFDNSDFVIEPVCSNNCKCEECKHG
jgi:hypothetical protein